MDHSNLESAKKEMEESDAAAFKGTTDNCNIIECYNHKMERIGHIYSSYDKSFNKIFITRYAGSLDLPATIIKPSGRLSLKDICYGKTDF